MTWAFPMAQLNLYTWLPGAASVSQYLKGRVLASHPPHLDVLARVLLATYPNRQRIIPSAPWPAPQVPTQRPQVGPYLHFHGLSAVHLQVPLLGPQWSVGEGVLLPSTVPNTQPLRQDRRAWGAGP